MKFSAGSGYIALGSALILALFFLLWVTWPSCGSQWVLSGFAGGDAHQRQVGVELPVTPDESSSVSERLPRLERLGQAGDSYGSFNALVGVLTVVLLFLASAIQWTALKESRENFDQQRIHIDRQNFEDHFFRLLELSRQLGEEFHGKFCNATDGERELRGFEALNAFASKVSENITSSKTSLTLEAESNFRSRGYTHKNNPELKVYECLTPVGNFALDLYRLVNAYRLFAYEEQPSVFGPYMRVLYRVFVHIDRSVILDDEKKDFIKIATATIPEGAVFLLALNGLTSFARNTFHPLIERFGLLEHMHAKYRNSYASSLYLAYSKTAFKLDEILKCAPPKKEMASFEFEEGRPYESC